MPTKEWQKSRRERLSLDGVFKRRDFFLHPSDIPEIARLVAEMRRKRLEAMELPPDQYCD